MKKFSQHILDKPSTFNFNVKISFDKPSDIIYETFTIEATSSISITAIAENKEEAKENVKKVLDLHKVKYEFIDEQIQ
jgi:hypothetical protein